MARARPAQRPRSAASFGNRSGPSTSRAIAKISAISVKPTSNMPQTLVLLFRLDGALALLEVRILATQVLDLPGGLLLALVDRLLEAPDGGAEIGADAAQLLRPEEDQGDDEDDEQLTKPDSH